MVKESRKKPRRGRPPLFGEKLVATNFRLQRDLLEELEEAVHALGKRSIADLVRDALRSHLDDHAGAIKDYRRFRRRHESA